jgi:hypothetical protein
VTRSRFLLIGAIVPGLIGLVMMLAPGLMLDNSLADPAAPATREVTRWVGFAVFALASITFLSRNDSGSPALRAVLVGNLVFHALGIVIDTRGYAVGAMTASGLATGLVPHALLGLGFAYYLARTQSSGTGLTRQWGRASKVEADVS